MKPSEHLLPCHIFSAGFPGAYTYARTLKPVLVQQPLPWRTIKMLPSKHLAIDESCNHSETFPRPTVLEEHHILFLASLKLHLLFRLNTLQHTLIFQLTNMKASSWVLYSWPSTKGTAQICHSWTVDYLTSVHLKIYFKGTHCAAQQFSLAYKTEIALQCLIHIYSFTELYFGNTFSIAQEVYILHILFPKGHEQVILKFVQLVQGNVHMCCSSIMSGIFLLFCNHTYTDHKNISNF